MLEKLKHVFENDTDVQESTEMDSLSSKNKEGLNSNNELRAKVDGYQKSLSERDEIIQQLTEQAGSWKQGRRFHLENNTGPRGQIHLFLL